MLVIGLAAVFTIVGPNAAQAASESLTTLTRIESSDNNGVAQVAFGFDGPVPQYDLMDNGTAAIRLTIHNASLQTGYSSRLYSKLTAISINRDKKDIDIIFSMKNQATADVQLSAGALTVFCSKVKPNLGDLKTLPNRDVALFRLRYADVSEVAGIIVPGSTPVPSDVFIPQTSNLGQSSLNTNGVAPSTTAFINETNPKNASSFGERVSDAIAIDRRLNAILVFGTPEQISAVRDVIGKIDVPLATVSLEVEIVELTDSAARDIGVDVSAAGNAGTASLAAHTLSTPDSLLNLQATIYAAITKGDGRIIARPRLSTLDGKVANILTGDALPVITNITVPGGGTSVVQQQVQYINVGVSLQLRPQVGENNVVTSHIFSEVSSVKGYVNGNIPTVSQRQVSTIATVRDGESFVIGGLLQTNELRSLTSIPFLSNLPILGNLFKTLHYTYQHTNLYLVITPKVTRGLAE